MNKSLHTALVKICTSVRGPLFHSTYDGVVVVTPRLVTGDDAIQETVTFSLVLVQ
jgi:hypothetical protein